MSQIVVEPSTFAERVRTALVDGLHRVGIAAEVDIEPVPTTLLHRAMVVSSQWSEMDYMDRQEVVWRILDTAFSRDEQIHISTVTTLTPEELEGN